MNLANLWLIIDVVFWVGFFVLEGFDFGVGMLHAIIGKDDTERRICVNAIGPVWDGNEVWLIVAGAVIFAAFPLWYATMFSTLYLAVVALLLALIARGLSFEYARKSTSMRWRVTFRWCLTVGSALIPFLLGVALGDLLHGLPLNAEHVYTGSFWGLLTPFGLMTGATMVVLSLFMGAAFLGLRTTGALRARARRYETSLGLVAIAVVWGYVTWAHLGFHGGFLPSPIEVVAVLAIVAAAWTAAEGAEGWAFAAGAVAVAASVITLFVELYPNVMVSTTATANSITVASAASPSYSLRVMTVVAVVIFPVVLVYQAWSYRVFRHRLGADDTVPSDAAPPSDDTSRAAIPPS
jgi:cytochrome d ubiquinol oxidase subunit II